MIDELKTYFNPGQVVRVRHEELENRPAMWVVEKVTRSIKKDGIMESSFAGIKCRWYDNNNVLQEALFSSKDLEYV